MSSDQNAYVPPANSARRESRLNPLVVGTAILLFIIAGTNFAFIMNLREASLKAAEAGGDENETAAIDRAQLEGPGA